MAWEWVSPVAAASGGVVGGGLGAFFTWLTGKQSRDQVVKTLEEQFGHDRLQAREAREQERLENAYLELVKMAARVGNWAQMVYPTVETAPLPKTPLPSLEVQADTTALLAAFGSDKVRQLAETWEAVVRQMIDQADLAQWEESNPPQPGDPRLARPYWNSPRWAIDQSLRPKEKQTRAALGAQIRSELAFGYRSTRTASGFIGSYTWPATESPPPSTST
jgi:hypothetical protein